MTIKRISPNDIKRNEVVRVNDQDGTLRKMIFLHDTEMGPGGNISRKFVVNGTQQVNSTASGSYALTLKNDSNSWGSRLLIQSMDDAGIVLDADTNNWGEDDNAFIHFKQDGGLTHTIVGHVGSAEKDPLNEDYSWTLANSFLIGTKSDPAVSPNLQLGTVDTVAMTITPGQRIGIGTRYPYSRVRILDIGPDASANTSDGADLKNYSLMICSQSIETNQIGLGFRISTVYEDKEPGAGITFERTGTESKGKMHFKTKGGTSALGECLTRMSITDAGEVIKSYQPSFAAYRSTHGSAVTKDTFSTIVFNAEHHDVGSDYDIGTGIFSIPVDGKYFFSTSVTIDQNSTDATYYCLIINSTGGESKGIMVDTADIFNAAPAYYQMALSGIFDCSDGDSVKVQFYQSGGTNSARFLGGAGSGANAYWRSNFSGYLLG